MATLHGCVRVRLINCDVYTIDIQEEQGKEKGHGSLEEMATQSAGHFITPPSDVRLSDAPVFLGITTGVPIRQRHVRWPADFNSDGDIEPPRWPMGEPVVLWTLGCHSSPCMPDYYVYTGG
ncbi:uncharacterized protein N7525_005902 [Penicillium rubens]|uniref:uncharacterized protein n=1 Tax=Penicillium rubens TaxID=1108849 RepID=UPI002A5A3057|nr:uncharacterized protein N7525_005902 [Penicillium rubens]KAJ5840714.1 hypothetical protein N7525_005902 [Penicillium rubens]KAJ5868695.1 hypothetical protein N7534_003248 [Penicillium rubens]